MQSAQVNKPAQMVMVLAIILTSLVCVTSLTGCVSSTGSSEQGVESAITQAVANVATDILIDSISFRYPIDEITRNEKIEVVVSNIVELRTENEWFISAGFDIG